MRSFSALFIAVPTLVPLAFGLSGCGGGGGMGSPSGANPLPVASSSPVATPNTATENPGGNPLQPNYTTELNAVRQWNKAAVTVSFVPPAADSNGTVRNIAPLVQQAVDMWNQKVGPEIRLQLVNENAAADITIQWTAFAGNSGNAIGLTEVTYRGEDEVLQTAKVRIEQSLPDSYQVQVIAHELGHSLGIDGHSQNSTDLMYTNAHLPAEVTTRDQNTILVSYQNRSRSAGRSAGAAGNETKTVVQYLCGADSASSQKR